MEQHRRRYAENLTTEIRQVESYLTRDEDTLTRFSQNKPNAFTKVQIPKLKENIRVNQEKLAQLQDSLYSVHSGGMDDDIMAEIELDREILKRKQQELNRIKRKQQENNQERKKISKRFYRDQQDDDRKERRMKRMLEREYEFFLKKCDSVPDYLTKKLADMPENKGYIFKGIWLFGKRRAEPNQPQVMFERKNKEILWIHEINEKEHLIYEKRGKVRKRLIERRTRRTFPKPVL